MTIPKFWPKPIPRLFLRYQIFRNRNRDFFPRPNFSETETDTFLPRPNFPKPRLFSESKFFRNQNQDFFPRPNFFETETETFFPRPNFLKSKPKPSKIWQNFRNREVLKLKCQSLTPIKYVNICLKSSKLSMFLKQNSDFLISESTQIIWVSQFRYLSPLCFKYIDNFELFSQIFIHFVGETIEN